MIEFRRNGGWSLAKADRRIFRLWEQGEITAKEGAEMIAKNNDLVSIPTEQEFVFTAWSLGYGRYGDKD